MESVKIRIREDSLAQGHPSRSGQCTLEQMVESIQSMGLESLLIHIVRE